MNEPQYEGTCRWCGQPFKNYTEEVMAPEGPDGTPMHYSCHAELTCAVEDLREGKIVSFKSPAERNGERLQAALNRTTPNTEAQRTPPGGKAGE